MSDASSGFVHLHLHTEYSMLDGANRPKELVERCRELGMDAVAITDHGNLHGAIEFYTACKDAGIKPILGIEAYVAPGDRRDRTPTGVQDGGFHLVLLAESLAGWHNLLKLTSDSFVHGFYYKPRMDKTTLAQWSEGLIAINGHLGSSIAHHLRRYVEAGVPGEWDAALAEARWHAETFGTNENGEPRFFVELQRHVEPQEQINPYLVRLARELELPLVCDNDSHFLRAEDWDAHDTLCCISMGKVKSEENRLRYPKDLYVKSPAEMGELFDGYEAEPGDGAGAEALANTRRIADRCDVELDFSANHAPVVKIEKEGDPRAAADARHERGTTEWFKTFCGHYKLQPFDEEADKELTAEQLQRDCDQALRELTEAGLVWRYGEDGITQQHRERLERELGILSEKEISAYFLIVWDFVNEGRRRGIPCSARGSGVATMVGYVLGLSNACPVQYGLLFERFTDPDRAEYPDIDIDICQDGRAEIIEYVRQKYGHVAQIITFGTLKARAAIRDVGRVLGVPLATVDKVCKLVGETPGMTIDRAVEQEPDLKALVEGDDQIREVIDTARRLEGMCRHAGVHAAGAVVATQPLENIVPLYQPPGTSQLVTQWDGPTVEKVGLLKMDFLGLRTLTIIERARRLVRESLDDATIRATVGVAPDDPDPLDLERLEMTDENVFGLFSRGETGGVFQFESGGMQNMLRSMRPDRLEDLIAANALYRPGPMDLIPQYVDRKHGREAVPSVHPIVDGFTEETYGVMVYQEQVMQIVNELGGIPLRAAYTLIKAISKKKEKTIEANREPFLAGAQERGLTREQAEQMFELVLKFAGYGFNKAHSTGYAILAYQTAYLKTYFPVEYMAALLTYESISTDKVVEYIDECRQARFPGGGRGIDVRPPDINRSDVAFTPVFEPGEPRDADHGHIRFGLSAVKNVGEKAIEAIIAERDAGGPFRDLHEFCERVPLQTVNRTTVEALIKCGAFDELHGLDARAAMIEALDDAIRAGQRAAADRDAGQLNMFEALGGGDEAAPAAEAGSPALPQVPAWSTSEALTAEKEVLGFYVSSHPLDEHREALARFANTSVAEAKELPEDTPVVLGGMVSRLKTTLSKKSGEKMAFLSLEDKTGEIESVVFPSTYAVAAPVLEADAIVLVEGELDHNRDTISVRANRIVSLERAPHELTDAVRIVLEDEAAADSADHWGDTLARLRSLLQQQTAAGRDAARAEVRFEVRQNGHVVHMGTQGMRVGVDPELPARIQTVLNGHGRCELVGPPRGRPGEGRNGKRNGPRKRAAG